MTDARRGLTAFVLLGAVALLLLLLGNLNRFAPVQSAVGSVTVPVQQALAPVTDGIRYIFGGLFGGSGTRAENERLRAEVDRLTAENVRLRQLQFENNELRQQLGFTAAQPDLPVVNARVVGRDPASLRQYLVLDKGSRDGVALGMAVVHPGGSFVGQVSRVEESRSEVLLVTDVDSSVNSKVERTRADGIVEGRWQKGGFLEMRYIEQGLTADGRPRVREGDWVVTSGLGGNVPDGLLVGRVESVKQSDTGLEQQAVVLPAVDVRSIETALIVRKP